MRRDSLAFVVVATTLAATPAFAEPTEVGGFFGPRTFSTDSALGYLPDAPFHPNLHNGVQFGARVGKPFGVPYFVPELELTFVPTQTTEVGGASSASVYWFAGRFQARIDLLPKRKLNVFLLAGAAVDIGASTARMTFNS